MIAATRRQLARFLPWLAVIGPGLVVMLADTDSGSLITSAQMGAQFGYKLLFQSFVLIPIVFIAQELTVRLGLVTGKGHGELIKEHFGKRWAYLSVCTLLVSCIGAMVTELIGMIGVGQLFGVPAIVMVLLTIGFLMTLALTGSFKSVERVALLVGLFEFVFFAIAIKAHPTLKEAWHGFITFPENRKEYLYLTAANLGAVVMPWMIFYQQSAVVDKGLNVSHMKAARWDTAIGAVITQLIMISILVAVAATIGKDNPGAALNSVGEISQALTPYLGMTLGKLLFAFGIMGACLVAAIVVTCAAAWGLGEVLGYRRSLSDSPKKAPWFYVVYAAILIISGVFVSAHVVNLITLNIAVEVMNALLLPIVLGFLYLLATKALPEKYRLKNKYKWVCLIVLGGSAFIGLFAGLVGS